MLSIRPTIGSESNWCRSAHLWCECSYVHRQVHPGPTRTKKTGAAPVAKWPYSEDQRRDPNGSPSCQDPNVSYDISYPLFDSDRGSNTFFWSTSMNPSSFAFQERYLELIKTEKNNIIFTAFCSSPRTFIVWPLLRVNVAK